MRYLLNCGLMAAFLVMSLGQANADVINIDIQQNGGPIDKTGFAAAPDAEADPVWNVLGTAGGALNFSDGSASGATLAALSGQSGTFRQQAISAPVADPLIYDYAFAGANATINASVTGLAAGDYDVYIYGGLNFQINGNALNTFAANGLSEQVDWRGIDDGHDPSVFVEGRNYVRLEDVVVDGTGVLNISATNDLAFNEVTLGGIQIVSTATTVPEPSSLSFLAIFGLALLRRRN